jgi:hypothetical protein
MAEAANSNHDPNRKAQNRVLGFCVASIPFERRVVRFTEVFLLPGEPSSWAQHFAQDKSFLGFLGFKRLKNSRGIYITT